ncbi:MAG: viroplasmin family protein [Clostridium sp.]
MAKKYYAIKKGLTPGIVETWDECKSRVTGFSGAQFKSFTTLAEAEAYMGISSSGNNTEVIVNQNKEKVKPVKEKVSSDKINKIGYDVEPIKSKAKVKSSKTYINPSEIHKDFDYVAFVDGSYDKNNKVFGSGVVVLNKNLTDYKTFYEAGYDEWDQWNIVGELEATKLALKKAEETGAKNVAIYHDLKNISLWATGEWKAKNRYTQEYVRFIEDYSQRLNIYFIKVKAHSNESIYNDLADEAAKNAIIKYVI